MFKKPAAVFIVRLFIIVVLFLGSHIANAASAEPLPDFSAESMFDRMEKNSDNYQAISTLVELQNSSSCKKVTLSIKSPDKFAIIFDDSSVRAYYNGQRLWVYVKSINEVFYHFSDRESYFSSYFSLVNPKKIFTNLTRKTLFSLFQITPMDKKTQPDNSAIYRFKFVPHLKSLFKQLFAVGYYEMAFSDKNYLPVEVVEFDNNGRERGRLKIIEYRLNEQIADEEFNFEPPNGVVMVPIEVVVAQKIEEYARTVVDKIGQAAEKIKRSLLDWSF